ncbi:hypothetical protein M3Y97_00871400 [Aphelenchoides bicaudatus]|nr:hypothetical protein M3Y97_00871400 [Aphelenchoides bicaudatus]
MGSRGNSEDRDVRFAGFGDRVGGLDMSPSRWKGGELITDPAFVTKSLKPRTMFYSPIGHGCVAADGIELKRGPVDLTPKVEIIHQRVVEKGPTGQVGRTVTERTWTTGGGGSESEATSQISAGPVGGYAQPQNAAGPVVPPKPAGDSFGSNSGFPPANTAQSTAAAPVAPQNNASPFGGLSDPLGLDLFTTSAPPSNYNSLGSRAGTDPYATLASLRSGPGPYDSLPKSDTNGYGTGNYKDDYPASGRTSTTSALFSEPGYRYEIEKYYKVTNPKELIHQYATTTPVHTIPGYESLPDGGMTTRVTKQSYSSSTEESFSFPPYASGPNSVNPNKFVRQLRDDNLTVSQKQANQNLQPLNVKDSAYDQRIEQIRRQTQSVSPNPEVDNLTSRMVTNLHTRKY